jgi:hypothetical protein
VAACLLHFVFRIPLKAWKFVCCVYCVGRGLCGELITHSEESYGMCMFVGVWLILWDLKTFNNEADYVRLGVLRNRKVLYLYHYFKSNILQGRLATKPLIITCNGILLGKVTATEVVVFAFMMHKTSSCCPKEPELIHVLYHLNLVQTIKPRYILILFSHLRWGITAFVFFPHFVNKPLEMLLHAAWSSFFFSPHLISFIKCK